MSTDLSGRKAWICGASKGIGRAIAAELADRGASLTLIARDQDLLKALADELPGSHHSLSLDLSDLQALPNLIAAHLAQGHVPEILINNSGGPPPGPVLNAAPEAFITALTQQLLAAQFLAPALVPGIILFAADGTARLARRRPISAWLHGCINRLVTMHRAILAG